MSKLIPEWLILVLTILSHIVLSKSQSNCLNSSPYTNHSTYATNLNTIISSLSDNISSSGFYNASIGQNPDRIEVIVLCRGDISIEACRVCIDSTARALVQQCLNFRDAIFWNETCMIRYSSKPIFGRLQLDPVSQSPSFSIIPSNRELYNRELIFLLETLRGFAANGGSFQKVAAGNRSVRGLQTMNALEQCTPDISADECIQCLTRCIQDIRTCCYAVIGSGILRPSCYLRFENYHFYSHSMVEVQVPQGQLPSEGHGNTTRTAVIVGVSIAVFIILAVTAWILIRRWRKQQRMEKLKNDDNEISTVESLQYDLERIRAATKDFSDDNKLGQGGFGDVYRGILPNGQEIAVKRLSRNSGQGIQEFKNELVLLARLQHRNLVRLLGFSIEGTERLLVYEFVENRSLDHFIFDRTRSSELDWDRRYKIIVGIARGIIYLHEDSRLRIIHRDLKASNVLLDGEMNPKISDFGMARLFEVDETQGNTSTIVGTYGYMSPEYAMHGEFSIKSDVFSYGVIILEIMSGQRNNSFQNEENIEDLLTYTWKSWCEGRAENVIDPVLRGGSGSLHDMLRCIHIGLLCVQENAADRPTMASILMMLNNFSVTLQVPSEPAFFVASRYGPDVSVLQDYGSNLSNSTSTSKSKTIVSEATSVNDVSVTELYPR